MAGLARAAGEAVEHTWPALRDAPPIAQRAPLGARRAGARGDVAEFAVGRAHLQAALALAAAAGGRRCPPVLALANASQLSAPPVLATGRDGVARVLAENRECHLVRHRAGQTAGAAAAVGAHDFRHEHAVRRDSKEGRDVAHQVVGVEEL